MGGQATSKVASSSRFWYTSHPWAQTSESTTATPSHGPPYQVMEEPRGPFLSLYNGGAALERGSSHPVGRMGATVGLEFFFRGARGQVWTFPQPPQGPGLQAPGHIPSSHTLGCRYWQAQPLTQLEERLIPLKNLR